MSSSSDRLDWFRTTLLAALGLATACGPERHGEDDESGAGESGTSETSEASSDGGATTSASTGDTGEPPVETCPGAEPIMQAGDQERPTGYVRCSDGSIQRVDDDAECADPSPGGTACPEASDGGCRVDADCTDRAHGRCVVQELGGLLDGAWCGCVYGCVDDTDCPEDWVCACGGVHEGSEYPASSRCIPADCEVGEGCATGVCALGSTDDGCGVSYKLACTTPEDTCVSNADCSDWSWCFPVGGHWQCDGGGACGRPLLVDGRPRTAVLASSDAWSDPMVRPSLAGLDASTRRVLADHWAEAALMEHASIASFARFCLQLMRLGAPSSLIAETTKAMDDETDHARRCFALASAYGGTPLGPGALEVQGAVASTRAEIIAALVEEACVGETLAAIEAEHAARLATDPAVVSTLRRIAADELRHATLGWRTLQWLLNDASPSMRPAAVTSLRDAVASARRTALRGPTNTSATLVGHGVLPASLRRTIVTRALEHVILPCFAALDVPDRGGATATSGGEGPAGLRPCRHRRGPS
jgi:hypothetical protein